MHCEWGNGSSKRLAASARECGAVLCHLADKQVSEKSVPEKMAPEKTVQCRKKWSPHYSAVTDNNNRHTNDDDNNIIPKIIAIITIIIF